MSTCNHDCKNCASQCNQSTIATNVHSNIKNVIAVVSGKGGVGKSLVTSMLAVYSRRAGYQTAVLDADITGPSIPHNFGLDQKAYGTQEGILPVVSTTGIKTMSLNYLTENVTDPVVWRGSMISNCAKQFYTDVLWQDVDYMFVDMPPGTGDVPLTVYKELPIKAVVVVTTPQDLVGMIVQKAINMAKKMNIPVIALVENMSYFVCDECNKKHFIYGKGNANQIAKENGIAGVYQLPLDLATSTLVDQGLVENAQQLDVQALFAQIVNYCNK